MTPSIHFDHPLFQDRSRIVCFDPYARPTYKQNPGLAEAAIRNCLLRAYQDGKRVFVSLCHRDYDYAAALAVMRLKADCPDVRLVLLRDPHAPLDRPDCRGDLELTMPMIPYTQKIANREALLDHVSGVVCCYAGAFDVSRNTPAFVCGAVKRDLAVYNGLPLRKNEPEGLKSLLGQRPTALSALESSIREEAQSWMHLAELRQAQRELEIAILRQCASA